ncbi:MAG: glycoside hydrolase family 78 protein [Duncaniella sp.]|nr:glycoside hydrolase family 78 protein [Duncaniella sp.]
MKLLTLPYLIALLTSLCIASAEATNLPAPFEGADWIAMDADSTIIFPHIHLLGAKSQKGKSLKVYEMPVLSKRVHLDGEVKSATAYVSGLGQYELYVDGQKADTLFLDPGWTMYNRRLLYNKIDVTPLMSGKDEVELAVWLGNGMYNIPLKGYHKMGGSCGAPKMILAVDIEYADGSRRRVVSDGSWIASESPVRFTSIYAGEWHDASFEGTRRPAVVTRPHWDVPIVEQTAGTRVRYHSETPAKKIGPNLYDFGKNGSGIVRLDVKGERGASVTVKPAEILKDGAVYQRSMPGYQWKYTLAGEPEGETWQPRFSYTGFRYAEVTADPSVEVIGVTGIHTTADVAEAGSFECSDTLMNRIHDLIDQAIRSNMVSITTDCPTREKLGWQEQNHLMAASMMYRYDVRDLFNKIADDLDDSQHEDGAIPTIAPEYTMFQAGSGFEDTPEWGASFILCPWYTYVWYGDSTAMARHYGDMKRYIDYLGSRAEEGILDYGLGDWFDIGPERPGKAQLTSVALTATAIYHLELATMAEIARTLGHGEDAEAFKTEADRVAEAFNARFLNHTDKVYENGSQTALAMALCCGLAEKGCVVPETMQALVADIEARGNAVTAGDIGYKYLVEALTENGADSLLYAMNTDDSLPGYAYQLREGATALTESWQAYDNVSNNHMMLGHLMEWLYGGIGGLRQADGSTAWERAVIAPRMVGDMKWARTSLMTPHGRLACEWSRDPVAGTWSLSATIPADTTATIHLPDGSTREVGEGRHSFEN